MNLQALIDHVIPDADQARKLAGALRAEHPQLSTIELAHHAMRTAKFKAAAAGAATGAASSPLTMIPAALADMVAVLRIEALLIGAIAGLLDPESLNDPKTIRADVITVLFPAAASQALRQVGIRAGERLSQAAMRKYATEDFVRSISRLATKYLGKQLTREAVLTKAVPLVGMGLGAGWNWIEVQTIGNRAIRYYSDEPIGPVLTAPGLPAPGKFWTGVRKYMPGKR